MVAGMGRATYLISAAMLLALAVTYVLIATDVSTAASKGKEVRQVRILLRDQPLLRGEPHTANGAASPAPAQDVAAAQATVENFMKWAWKQGAEIVRGEVLPASVVARVTTAVRNRIQRSPLVAAVINEEAVDQLDTAAPVVGAPAWWLGGHTGGGGAGDSVDAVVGLLSDPVLENHPAFAHLDVYNDPTEPAIDVSSATQHGTHVAGVVASGDPLYRGVTPGINTLNAGNTSFLVGLPTSTCCPPVSYDGAPRASDVINYSAGSPSVNDDEDLPLDLFVDRTGVGFATVAGNDMNEVVHHTGLNMVVVGGVTRGLGNPLGPQVLDASSRGPTPGGRKKPDLVAPASAITSANSHWARTSLPCNGGVFDPDGTCADFSSVSGTSFAAPFVTGAMALLEGAGISDPRAQRAILINSARPICNPGPCQESWDPAAGWGMLDLETAFEHRANFHTGEVREGRADFYLLEGAAADQRSTLAWNLRGILPFNPGNTHTVSNLDLHQYDADDYSEVDPPADPGHGGGPDALDTNDTVEQVRAPENGDYILKVAAPPEIEGLDTEPYAIAAAGEIEKLEAPAVKAVSPKTTPSGPVNCLTDVTISAAFVNPSDDLPIENAEVSVEIPGGLELIAGEITQELADGNLDPGEETEPISWTVRATSPGTKVIKLSGHGSLMGTAVTDTSDVELDVDCSPSRVEPVEVAAGPNPTICGDEVIVSSRFRNPTATTAGQATGVLNLPSTVQLVGGEAEQLIEGGTLAAGQLSNEHQWTIRLTKPGNSTVSVIGKTTDDGGTRQTSVQRSLNCSQIQVSVKVRKIKVVKKGRKVKVRGRLTSEESLSGGKVRIELRHKRRVVRKKVAPNSNGQFVRVLKIPSCRSGVMKVKVVFDGGVRFSQPMSLLHKRLRYRC